MSYLTNIWHLPSRGTPLQAGQLFRTEQRLWQYPKCFGVKCIFSPLWTVLYEQEGTIPKLFGAWDVQTLGMLKDSKSFSLKLSSQAQLLHPWPTPLPHLHQILLCSQTSAALWATVKHRSIHPIAKCRRVICYAITPFTFSTTAFNSLHCPTSICWNIFETN